VSARSGTPGTARADASVSAAGASGRTTRFQPGPPAAEAPRRLLTARQAALVDRIIEAAADDAREVGYDGLTVRSAARRAGVAPATAYTYFASKDHLLAEVLWRRVRALPPVEAGPRGSARTRVVAALTDLALFMADDPEVAAAGTTALLGNGPEVRELRTRIGTEMHRRVEAALGDDADPAAVRALDLAYFGAMLAAGMGHLRFEDLPGVLEEVVDLVLGRTP